MKQNKFFTTKKQRELTVALNRFYQKPGVRVSLELLLSVFFVIILIVVAIKPTLVTMTELTKEINEKKEIDKKLPKKIAALSSAQATLLNLQDELPLLDEALPEKIDIVYYLKIIEYEASNNDLTITGIGLPELPNEDGNNPSKIKQEKTSKHQSGEKILNGSVTVDGSYKDIKNFIKALEKSRASFLINSVSFATKKINGKSHLLASIILSLPYFKE